MDIRRSLSTLLLVLIPASLCFSLRLSTFFAIVYGFNVVLTKDVFRRFAGAIQKQWVIPFLVLFALHACSLFWTENIAAGKFILEKKAALLAIPILVGMDRNVSPRLTRLILTGFICCCCGALWYCLTHAGFHYLETGNIKVFFYHELGMPLNGINAIYLSFFLFLSVVFLHYLSRQEDHFFAGNPVLRWFMIGFLSIGIILLSSKLFIFLLALFLLFTSFIPFKGRSRPTKNHWGWITGLTVLIFGLILFNPIRHRFREILDSQFQVLQLEEFRYDTPFNSLTLRLLLIKFGWEILDKDHAFFQGVGVGDAQDKLDAMIIDYNVYHGNPSLNDKGYLGYDFHDQWMQLWVQTGVFGPLIWMYILGSGFYFSRYADPHHPLIYIVLTLFLFSFTESFLERQRGVLTSAFFLSFFIKSILSDIKTHGSKTFFNPSRKSLKGYE